MRPTLGKWLEQGQPLASTEGVKAWLNRPLPAITHRMEDWNKESAFVQFKEGGPCPNDFKEALLVSSQLKPKYEAQLVFDDLSKVSREWSLSFHKEVISDLELCAVTGTNGKSSVVHFFSHLMAANPKYGVTANLGTLGLKTQCGMYPSPNTTPFPLDLHPMLNQVVKDGHRLLMMEASSHALDQNRLEGLSFKAAGFTNLTQDHLDYHETMEHLFASKSKLLDLCEGNVLINLDCEWFSRHRQGANVMTYSCIDPRADLYAKVLSKQERGFKLEIHYGSEKRLVHLPLLGDFNVSNILCSLGMALSLDETLDDYCDSLESLEAPKGRLQLIECPAKGRVIIDYAHTPDALQSVLKTMKSHLDTGKMKVLFGCGGNRDKSKRYQMGEIASRYADYTYLTSDNPRFEKPESIIKDIEKGMLKDSSYEIIVSREEAIESALKNLKEDELLLLCGKGHETTQEVMGQKYPMCEEELCQRI